LRIKLYNITCERPLDTERIDSGINYEGLGSTHPKEMKSENLVITKCSLISKPRSLVWRTRVQFLKVLAWDQDLIQWPGYGKYTHFAIFYCLTLYSIHFISAAWTPANSDMTMVFINLDLYGLSNCSSGTNLLVWIAVILASQGCWSWKCPIILH